VHMIDQGTIDRRGANDSRRPSVVLCRGRAGKERSARATPEDGDDEKARGLVETGPRRLIPWC